VCWAPFRNSGIMRSFGQESNDQRCWVCFGMRPNVGYFQNGIHLLLSREVCYTFYLSSLIGVRVTAVSVNKFLKEKKNIMSQTIRRCVSPCSRSISDYITHELCFECLCLSMASSITVSCSPLSSSCTSQGDRAEEWETGPSLSPDRDVLPSTAEDCAYWEWAEDVGPLVNKESNGSEITFAEATQRLWDSYIMWVNWAEKEMLFLSSSYDRMQNNYVCLQAMILWFFVETALIKKITIVNLSSRQLFTCLVDIWLHLILRNKMAK